MMKRELTEKTEWDEILIIILPCGELRGEFKSNSGLLAKVAAVMAEGRVRQDLKKITPSSSQELHHTSVQKIHENKQSSNKVHRKNCRFKIIEGELCRIRGRSRKKRYTRRYIE
ncbi:uncharacterized protein LOC117176899 [Belonocnema kinseyi]|uniref:uncharacterized protein LOC117176899 n=1 Tax=Belonocnema kinseyi TaxID=2817044 RepID=UPI00143DCCBF|nr:uncharacterized protein LOC117176899 [Belonocnema kinseyi]